MEVYLDRGNGRFVFESLQNCKDIIDRQNDENLLVDWEILECRALQQLERIADAKRKYENICTRYPRDSRPFLYLAEICLNDEEYDRNDELLREAEKIDKSDSLLKIEKLLRDQRLGNTIDTANIDEQNFPTDPRMKASFYRFYAFNLQLEKDFTRAESFIERAINLNPDRLANYIAKLGLLEFPLSNDIDQVKIDSEKLLLEIDAILGIVSQWGQLSPRNQVIFNLKKLMAFYVQENISETERLAKESFDLVMRCHFDVPIDHYLALLLMNVQLPQDEFDRLIVYLRRAEKGISDDLAKALIFQFILRKTLFSEGRLLFEDKAKEDIRSFVDYLENKNYDGVWNFMKDDLRFAIAMANAAKDFPDLRRKIIEKLPDDGNIQKEKLILLLNFDESNFDEAFAILKGLDLSQLRYFECAVFLEIARKKEAWEFVIVVLEKLLQYEQDKHIALQLKLELFDANLKIERLPEAIEIGERILSNRKELSLLNEQNREGLLANTVLSIMTRGDYPRAMTLVEMYPDIPKTVEFKVGVEAEVYLKNREASKAIESVVAGMKILRTPTPEQYAKLLFVLIQIDNMLNFPLTSAQTFEAESFVKFRDQERWYFVGDRDELDAIKIPSTDERYAKFSDRKPGDKVIFDFEYRKNIEHFIESILPIDKYIFSQAVRHFNQMAADGNLRAVEMIEVPKIGDTIDTKNIIARLEDERKGRGEFFDLYCRENVPLAFLAISEGGLTRAIGLIQNEGRGFIRFSSGETAEIERQKDVARRIIAGNPFYLDGTSALILSETGLLGDIYAHLPNLKVPQSVIAMLLKCKEQFRYVPGQAGRLNYVKGQLLFSEISPDQGEALQKKFANSIGLLESKPENIGIISAASKRDCLSEQKVPAELCDACVLAQKDEVPVLTEDYLYLQMDQIETGKKAPEYCSAFALIRVLYEQKKITFEKYLEFFAYLSGYRFRFLPITSNDIEKAIFGDGIITMVRPGKIGWFNFPLTLSEEYGVPFASSFGVIALFLIRVITDDTILPDIVGSIFLEILSVFPTDKDKRFLAQLFVKVCVQEMNKMDRTIIVGTRAQKKIDRLSQIANIYNASNQLWTPRN
jgi:tetratricopeptide (TPR) repeat protein